MGAVTKISFWTAAPLILAILMQTVWLGNKTGRVEKTIENLELVLVDIKQEIKAVDVAAAERVAAASSANRGRIERLENWLFNDTFKKKENGK